MNAVAPEGLGAILRTAREAAGMSEQQVGDTLRLPASVVRTLEANGFQTLPAPAYARGYVRAYARLLELDAEALLYEHQHCLGADETPPLLLADNGRKRLKDVLHERLGWVFGGAALVVGLVASGVLWWAWPQETAAIAAPPPPPTAAAAVPSPSVAATRPPAVATPSPAFGDGTVPDSGAIPNVAPPAAAEPAVGGGQTDIATPAAPPAGRALAFAFAEDCWVEVADRMDRIIHRQLNRAGETLLLHGETPLRIRLGNAPGVALEYDGHAVALGPHTRNRVANLVLE